MEPSEEIIFEKRDLEIFKISDVKTKLDTLQNYFFPRMERLLKISLEAVSEVYGVNPYDKFSIMYRPSHRKNALKNADYNEVHIGISGRRVVGKTLKTKKPDGKNFTFHASFLLIKFLPAGSMRVELFPYRQNVDYKYIKTIKSSIRDELPIVYPALFMANLSYHESESLTSLEDVLSTSIFSENSYYDHFYSAPLFFPIDRQGIFQLVKSFVVLYPFLDTCYEIAEGRKSQLKFLLSKLKNWNWEHTFEEINAESSEELNLPELTSYKFVRHGLWWQVLALDHWTCCSCGRKAKDGVTLEVDHILPRSKGGKDELANLQTLCKKCNIGKSNKDDTDLRSL